MSPADFFEPDEPVSKIVRAFERGEKGRTCELAASTLGIYCDARGSYRWRLKATSDGRIVASSSRGYRALSGPDRKYRGVCLAQRRPGFVLDT